MRAVFALLLAGTFSMTGAHAEPLAPGRPAGVRAARVEGWNAALMIGTGAVILAAVGILVGRNSSAALTVEHFDANQALVSPSSTG